MPLAHPRPARRPLILGHRGHSAAAPDNSLEAFRLAIASGADGVELDVRFTSDGAFALSHDPSIRGYGMIAQRSLDDLRAYQPDVALLDEAAAILGDAIINVEIKNSPTEPDYDPTNSMAEKIAEWVAEGDRYGQCLVTSFNSNTIARVGQVDPTITTGQLLDQTAHIASSISEAANAGHTFVALHKRLMQGRSGERIMAQAESLNLEVAVWTVNQPRQWKRLQSLGVAAVIVNDPGAALSAYGT